MKPTPPSGLAGQIESHAALQPGEEQFKTFVRRWCIDGKGKKDGCGQRDHRLPEELGLCRQAFGIALNHLAIVIDPAEPAVAERNNQHHDDKAVAHVSPQHGGDCTR